MNWGKRGQVAVEFLILIVIAFTVFIMYAAVTRDKMDELRSEEEHVLLKDVVYMARNEILIASKVEDGYYREFVMPDELDLKYNYSINITGEHILATSENHQQMVSIPTVNGTLKKGLNIVNKTGGVIYLS